MNEKEIIQKLTEIKKIARMKREEVYEKIRSLNIIYTKRILSILQK
ncbi:hypothetical protein SD457_11010 [Coprobacillaceae bacterium CR2/5/TPMF4]|nr:hypothetical protein SD457_11010 [Coprobacillaceae bacterium CR2/5/TPMF4]